MDFWIAGAEEEVECWEVPRLELGCAGWVNNEALWMDLVSPVLRQ